MNFPAGERVDVIRPLMVIDRHGNQAPDWTATSEHRLPGCGIAPGDLVEVVDTRESGVEVDHTLFVPAGHCVCGGCVDPVDGIRATDRLRFRGDDHDVVGGVNVWRSPFSGWTPGCVVRTKRVVG